MHRLRDVMLDAPDEVDPARVPPRFVEAQSLIRNALADADVAGIPDTTLAAVLMSEAIPRLVGTYGPDHAARLLAMFAGCLSASAPSSRQ